MPLPPEEFGIASMPTPIGAMLIVFDRDHRMRALNFADHEPRMRRELRLHYGHEGPSWRLREMALPVLLCQPLERYFSGELTALDEIQVHTAGTEFQRDVWRELRKIPAGTTLSYGQLAAKIGRPKAVRAVGMANGANPVGVVVPCHRVIGADASLTGYGGGLHRKHWLLTHDGAKVKGSGAADPSGVKGQSPLPCL